MPAALHRPPASRTPCGACACSGSGSGSPAQPGDAGPPCPGGGRFGRADAAVRAVAPGAARSRGGAHRTRWWRTPNDWRRHEGPVRPHSGSLPADRMTRPTAGIRPPGTGRVPRSRWSTPPRRRFRRSVWPRRCAWRPPAVRAGAPRWGRSPGGHIGGEPVAHVAAPGACFLDSRGVGDGEVDEAPGQDLQLPG